MYAKCYDGIRRAIGPTQSKMAPLKTAVGEALLRTVLQGKHNIWRSPGNYRVTPLPSRRRLDEKATMEQPSKAADGLDTGEVPGLDAIPPELINCAELVFLNHLYHLFCQSWEEGQVARDTRNCNVVTLYKNKGDRSDCNSYREISLLSIVGNVCARVMLNRLQNLDDRVYSIQNLDDRVYSIQNLDDRVYSIQSVQHTECTAYRVYSIQSVPPSHGVDSDHVAPLLTWSFPCGSSTKRAKNQATSPS